MCHLIFPWRDFKKDRIGSVHMDMGEGSGIGHPHKPVAFILISDGHIWSGRMKVTLKLDGPVKKSKDCMFTSFPRRQESCDFKDIWAPASAGVTVWKTFYRSIILIITVFNGHFSRMYSCQPFQQVFFRMTVVNHLKVLRRILFLRSLYE